MPELVASQMIAGKYRLESLIGHGGMGSVWRARHATLDMPVAIKFMAPQALADAESRQRFDREARALAALRTPHIVQVLDHGVDGDTPYIVMEHLEGEDLSTRLANRRRLPLAEVSHILSHVARALRRAHDAGITHRDLKPSNIFIARIDDEEVVKVLDFGVAKLAQTGALGDDGLTKTGTLLGSPGYMSPEQARGKEVDYRSDLWALAVVIFRAVTGSKPFAGDSIAELVIKLCIDPRPVPSRIAGDLPPSVDRFFEKAFAANPEDRFPSAVDMAVAFAALAGVPSRLEASRIAPSPFAGVSRAALDAPSSDGAAPVQVGPPPPSAPSATPPSGQLPAPRPPPVPSRPPSGPLSPVRLPPPPSSTPPSGQLPAPRLPPPRPSGPAAAAAPPSVGLASPPLPPVPRPVVVPAPPPSHLPQEGTTVMAVPPPRASSPSAAMIEQPAPGSAAPAGAPPLSVPGLPPSASGQATLVLPPLGPIGAREPTPTPASFTGFAPTGAEASVPPASSPLAIPLPDGSLRAPPTGVPPSHVTGAHPASPPDPTIPPDMRAPSHLPPPPVAPSRPQIDVKVLIFAAAGAAVLAIFFSLAIAGLRRRHTEALRPADESFADPPAASAAGSTDPAEAPATDPSAAPSGSAEPTAAPSASADVPPEPSASATEPAPAPTPVAPKPVWVAPKPTIVPPRPKPTTTKPRPTSTSKTAPVPTTKKKTTR